MPKSLPAAILALDIALNRSGWAYQFGDDPAETGSFTTRGATEREKAESLAQEMRFVLARFYIGWHESDCESQLVVMEWGLPAARGMANSSWQTVYKLGGAAFVARSTVDCRVPVREVSPADWKLALFGHSNASKLEGESLLGRLNLPVPLRPRGGVDQDRVDARCLLLYARSMLPLWAAAA